MSLSLCVFVESPTNDTKETMKDFVCNNALLGRSKGFFSSLGGKVVVGFFCPPDDQKKKKMRFWTKVTSSMVSMIQNEKTVVPKNNTNVFETCLTSCVCVLLFVVLLDVLSRSSAFKSRKSPPLVDSKVPVVGGMLEFLKGPMKLMANAFPKHGEVFSVPVCHKRITFLLGPKVSQFFFKAKDVEMSQKEVYEFNVPTFGKGVVFDVDHQTRAEQFRFFADSLKSERLRTYVGMMVKEANAFFEKWGDEGEVDLLDSLSELIVLTASRCLLGREIRENLFSEVTALVHDLDKGMVPLSVFFPYAPIEAHRKRDAARKKLALIFDKVIHTRRESGSLEPDVLQTFIDARYKDGSKLTNDQVLGMLIAVLFAGQHTSSITSTWTGLLAIANKERAMPYLEQEQQQIMKKHGSKIDFDVLAEMDELHFAVKEALRMHPPLIMLLRKAQVPFDVETTDGKKYTIPKGHICATSPAFAHRMESVFKNPNTYDPQRYKTDKNEFASYIGFGAGRHGCMGETFAFMQIKTIWSVLIRKYEFELVGDFPEPDYEGMVVGPKHPCTIRYKKRDTKKNGLMKSPSIMSRTKSSVSK